MTSLLAKLTVDRVMTAKPVTVTEDVPLEEAARIMADRSIGGLPVLRDGTLVGIITESDLFRVFIELFGARQKGVRLTMVVANRRGELAEVTEAVTKAGGNIIALGTFLADDPTQGRLTMKVDGLAKEKILEALRPLAVRIEDVRES
jgi:acetoin utilization protein AcuB